MIVFRVSLDSDVGGYVDQDIESITSFLSTELSELPIGSKLVVHVEEMCKDSYNSLPEFDGF